MYVVDSSAKKATITLTGEEVAVKFPCTYSVFGIKGDDMLLYPKSGMVQGDDGVYDTAEGDGSVIMCLHYQADTVYIKGTGDCVIWAGNSTLDNPFKATGKGGGGSGGDNTHYKGTTTTAISNGSTTNPIMIDGEEYTAVFGDIVVYGYTEFVFDGTTWSEFGRPFDTTPISGSANAVTSDGIKTALDTKQNIMQYATMPTITASMLGKVVQYVGTSDSNYKQGWNYVAVSDGAAEPTYSWQALMDSAPTSGSNNPVMSGAVYQVTPLRRGTGESSAIFGSPNNRATGTNSVAEGSYTTASGQRSHAGGADSIASGLNSFAYGQQLQSTQENQAAFGKFNLTHTGNLFNIGNGTSASKRSNILEANSTSVNVNGDIQRNGVGIDDYTTTERKIGKWIDGSDLYQRTFEVTSTIHNDSQYYSNILGTSDSGINIVDFEGFVEFTDTDIVQRFSLHQPFGGSDFMLFFANNSDLTSRIKFDTNFTLSRAVITIKYTKPSVQANALNANIQQTEEPTDENR